MLSQNLSETQAKAVLDEIGRDAKAPTEQLEASDLLETNPMNNDEPEPSHNVRALVDDEADDDDDDDDDNAPIVEVAKRRRGRCHPHPPVCPHFLGFHAIKPSSQPLNHV